MRNEMKLVSNDDQLGCVRQIGRRDVADVGPVLDNDARVPAQFLGELAIADIERDHRSGAALKQHVGEAAGRCADIEGAAAWHFDLKMFDRGGELVASSTRVLRRATNQRDFGFRIDLEIGFRGWPRIYPDASGHDKSLRTFAAFCQSAAHHLEVKPGAHSKVRRADTRGESKWDVVVLAGFSRPGRRAFTAARRGIFRIGAFEWSGGEIALRIAAEDLDLLFDLVELLIEGADQGDATLEGADRIFQAQFAGIDLGDDLFEVFQFFFEFFGLGGH